MVTARLLNAGGRGRDPKRDGRRSPRSGSPRANSPRPKLKFIWSGNCWWCDSPDHKQPDCAAFKRAIEKNGGSKKGLEGAYKKAKKLWLEKNKKERSSDSSKPHLKAVKTVDAPIATENIDTEDESSDDDSTIFSPLMTLKPNHLKGTPATHLKQTLSAPARNGFAPLAAPYDADGEDNLTSVAAQLGTWAHTVKIKKSTKSKAQVDPKTKVLCRRGRVQGAP